MTDIWRDFWIRDTETGQQVAQLHDRYTMMTMMMMSDSNIAEIESRHPENGDTLSRRNIAIYTLHNNPKDNYFNQAHLESLKT